MILVVGADIGNRFVSLMDLTIFSRSMGVMCFSRPRLVLLLLESTLRSAGCAFGRHVAGQDVVSSSSKSSEMALSSEEERAGTGMLVAAAFGRSETSDLACDSGAQQNVSRFHNRQERFSNRLPSSIAFDAFEKSAHCEEAKVSGEHVCRRCCWTNHAKQTLH